MDALPLPRLQPKPVSTAKNQGARAAEGWEEAPGGLLLPARLLNTAPGAHIGLRPPERRLAASHSPSPQDEDALIKRILAGERELYYDLIRPYERSVFTAALAILQNEADAEEVAQEAVLKAFRNLGQFRGEARFSTWLVRIAINEARMRVRRQIQVRMEPLDPAPDEEGEYTPRQLKDWRFIPSEALEQTELRAALAKALASLGEKYREVLMLRDVQQLSIAETAEVLELTPANVKVRLLRARLQMRDLLIADLGTAWDPRRGRK